MFVTESIYKSKSYPHVIIVNIDQSSFVSLLTTLSLLFVIGSAKAGLIHVIIAIDYHFKFISIPRLILTANIANIHMLSE